MIRTTPRHRARFAAILCLLPGSGELTAQDRDPAWWSQAVQKNLDRAGANKPQLLRALRTVPEDQRPAMAFLIQYMPKRDLLSLRSEFLLDEVSLATEVRSQTAFGKSVPEAIFLNEVLPYANVSETREAWRRSFRDRFLPLVKRAKSTGEAAMILNKTIFGQVKVRYSTKRKRADQSPAESMEIGMASCTGLSILLIDACRSVGVPARLVGIPNWANKRGNHTWVEVWDQGWHFVGAAEPSPKGLDHAWFRGDAALAKVDNPKHSIYAVSYRHTGLSFPMIWAHRDHSVAAVNVTTRYTTKAPKAKKGHSLLMVCVRDKHGGERVSVPVVLADMETGVALQRGTSKGESFDTNDYLTFEVKSGQPHELRCGVGAAEKTHLVLGIKGRQKIVTVRLR